ncbi:MAG: MarR family transcriptional regulator, partial [Pseudomonadota bacterium]
LPNMIGVELRIAQILADRLFSSTELGMAPGHFTVLSLIGLNPGINQSNLARCMFLDRSSMVPILDQLQNRKLIERRSQATDRRSYALHLTREGRSAVRRGEKEVLRLEKAIAAEMGSSNRSKLLDLVKQFQSALLALQGDTAIERVANDR